MKEQRLIKKIEAQATRFKQRALKSPKDGKRHDQVRQDEKKSMWTALNELGWSDRKIGSVFDRDPRTVKKAGQHFEGHQRIHRESQEVQKQSQVAEKEANSNPRLTQHFDELATTAKMLTYRIERLLRYSDKYGDKTLANIIREPPNSWSKATGHPIWGPTPPEEEYRYEKEPLVDRDVVEWLFAHYMDRFGKQSFADWETVTIKEANQGLIGNLKLLARVGLQYCPNCPSCRMACPRS